ncbi:hypothetical protein ACIBQX_21080 [Nonomuraea sp. NPDC049714]|uniref:hypothetical protein n=1 Tax=Nonomuraea sp. NPDC049714 TaxID=3364357 RepID=UPI0037AE2E5D
MTWVDSLIFVIRKPAQLHFYARRALESAQRTESTWGLQHLGAVEKTLATQQDPVARELLGDLISTRRTLGSSPA